MGNGRRVRFWEDRLVDLDYPLVKELVVTTTPESEIKGV